MAARSQATLLPLPTPDLRQRCFSARGYVEYLDDTVLVWIGGTLLGQFDAGDRAARDSLVLAVGSGPRVHFGRLADAFGLSVETLRSLRRQRDTEGLIAALSRPSRGRPTKITPKLRSRIEGLLEEGLTIEVIANRLRGKLSMASVGRVRQDWIAQREPSASVGKATFPGDGERVDEQQLVLETGAPHPSGEDVVASEQMTLKEVGTDSAAETEATEDDDEAEDGATTKGADGGDATARSIRSRAPNRETSMQHAGAWILLGLLCADGLYQRAREAIESSDGAGKTRKPGLDDLYVAIDAVVLALAIGERSVEGVRRLATPTGTALLRATRVPSPAWVRSRLAAASADGGGLSFHAGVAADVAASASARTDEWSPVVFYVDNHMRPYTGKQTIRKGWRMQDRRARPGVSDYYVHDEDGRPVMRMDVPEHQHLTDWVKPLGQSLREALGPEDRILLAFDRGGSYPEHLRDLRDEGFEVLTYERKPYRAFPPSQFEASFMDDDEEILVHDTRKNLNKGRGRVRRVAFRFPSGYQINVLTTSDLPAETLYWIARHRWRQENGFKHGNERWGINQLDGRKTEPYPPDAIIPNPARRRLDRSLRVARQAEGIARNKLVTLEPTSPKYERAKDKLDKAIADREQLEALRPHYPTDAPVKDTELAGKLRRHTGEYKMLIDTIRVACANAESDLALLLAPHLPRPAEAKKVLSNLFKAPATVRGGRRSITVTLAPAATPAERDAIRRLLDVLSSRRLSLPRDAQQRRLVLCLQE
jgi:hypothetical protein